MDVETFPKETARYINLPPFPLELAEYASVDYGKLKVHVDHRYRSHPLLLSWLKRCERQGYSFKVEVTELDEVTAHQALNVSARPVTADDDSDLHYRMMALDLLGRASEYRASDIHILRREKFTEVQIGVDGEIRVMNRYSHEEGAAIERAFCQGISTVKDATYSFRNVQNAQISGDLVQPYGLSSVRIVRGPMYPVEAGCGFMVNRLQYGATTLSAKRRRDLPALPYPRIPEGGDDYESMGLPPAQVEKIEYTEEGAGGVHIINGPTGAGKSTTMYTKLRRIARRRPGSRIITIEKPVEYPMPWAIQLSLEDNEGWSDEGEGFEQMFRHTLRMAPKRIVPGELRTPGVGIIAFEAGRTGHVVDTTTHSDDAFSVPYRIELMDPQRLPLKMFCSARLLRSIINQRLVPKLCPHCSTPLSEAPHDVLPGFLWHLLETYGDLREAKLRGPGCKNCFQGYAGRQVLMEIVLTDPHLMRDFIDHGEDVARRNYRMRSDADKSVLAQAMEGALTGKYDFRDVGDYVDTIVSKDMVNIA